MLANPISSPDYPERVSCTAAGPLSPDESRPHPFHSAGQAPQSFFASVGRSVLPLSLPTVPSVLSERGDCKAPAILVTEAGGYKLVP